MGLRSSSSCLGTKSHEMRHQIWPPVCITSHIQPNAQVSSSCPRCFVDDPYLDALCRSKSGRGPTNDQAVDSPHNVLTSNAFPDNVPTKVSPNTVQQIVQPVRSSHAGFHAKAVTSQWQLVGRPRSEAVYGMSRQSCWDPFSKSSDDLQQNKPLEW